ncbi:uncharacterized protein LOC119452515 [Dermacentor silvarum]|uniref:uncharacterized protein LOC119452515 n=1 Tax=Dermacentor silvarum TaxID=543639 RepID=UPI002101A9D0|nr:uncharacterized protein LOC119452515 [Dermacentor silvarum]
MAVYALLFLPLFSGIGAAEYASSCTNFSFPNFLDIGSCLSSSGDLCNADSEGVAGFVAQLTQCTFAGLANLDIGSQTYLTIEFLKFLLRAETDDFGVVYPFIINTCKTLSTAIAFLTGGTVRINCAELDFDRMVVCGDPIFISVQATTPFAECLGKNGLTCDNQDPVYEPLALGSLRVLACLIYYVITTSPAEVAGQFGCDFITIISSIFGSPVSKALTPLLCTVQNALMLDCAGITC